VSERASERERERGGGAAATRHTGNYACLAEHGQRKFITSRRGGKRCVVAWLRQAGRQERARGEGGGTLVVIPVMEN
jgi:hypothetical protein